MSDIYESKLDGTAEETEALAGDDRGLSVEEAKTDALIALADTAANLSRAVQTIAAYTPTVWVDNSEPSINATRLNHIEKGIQDATAALNNAINAITEINGSLNSRLIMSDEYTAIQTSDKNRIPYRLQLSSNGGLVYVYKNDGSGWSHVAEMAKKGDLNELRSTYYTDQANHVIVTFTKRQGILYAKTAGPNGGGTGVLYLFGIHYDLKNITLIKIGGADSNVIASNTGLDYQFDMALLASDESTRFAYVTFMINQF